MTTIQLYKRVTEEGKNAPRALIVSLIKALGEDAKQLPKDKLLFSGDQSRSNFPPLKGVDFIGYISGIILYYDWDDDEELGDILSITSQLDIHTHDEALWQELFQAIDVL